MTQKQFAEKIRVSPNSIARYELGDRNPSDAVIFSICREFNVNEEWLRTGKGEMYSILEDETYKLIHETPFYSCISKIMNGILRVMKNYEELDDSSKDTLNELIKKLIEEK